MQTEQWLPVPGYEGRYIVSDHGRIMSLWFKGRKRATPKVMRTTTASKYGHQRIQLFLDGTPAVYVLSRLVLSAFVGPCPEDMDDCAHEDGNPRNNHISNLTWKTRMDNQHDRIRHGTDPIGGRNPAAKLSNEQTDALRADALTMSSAELAAKYGVSRGHVRKLITGQVRGKSNPDGAVPKQDPSLRQVGELNASSKLTNTQVGNLLVDVATMKTVAIAEKYGVSPGHVRRLARGEMRTPAAVAFAA